MKIYLVTFFPFTSPNMSYETKDFSGGASVECVEST